MNGFRFSAPNNKPMINEIISELRLLVFLGCIRYPECRYTYDLAYKEFKANLKKDDKIPNLCPKCGKELEVRVGKYGRFLNFWSKILDIPNLTFSCHFFKWGKKNEDFTII